MSVEREIAVTVWDKLYGLPYRWGGDDPIHGVDCSGLVIEGLKSAGVLQRSGDWTAQALSTMFPQVVGTPPQGALIFWDWNGDGVIDHVEIVWRTDLSRIWTLGAAAGGPGTTSADIAAKQNAYVMIRPARPNWKRIIDPF